MFFFMFGLGYVMASENPFRSEVRIKDVHAHKASVEIVISVPQGFHLYKDMMWVKPASHTHLKFSDPLFPKGVFLPDPANPNQYREHFDKTVLIELPVDMLEKGVHTTSLEVRYQGCKAGLCYRPVIDKHELILTSTSTQPNPAPTPKPQKKSFWSWLISYLAWI